MSAEKLRPVFFSAEKRDKGGGYKVMSLPLQGECIRHILRRKWYDITPAAGGINDITQYEMPCTGTHMGMVHPLKGKGGSYPPGLVPPFG